jgi:hypothetical protein
MSQLTERLGRVQAGNEGARDALFAAAYGELHRRAHALLRGGGRNTVLDTTCLVHESYLRCVHAGELRGEDRAPLTFSHGLGTQGPTRSRWFWP